MYRLPGHIGRGRDGCLSRREVGMARALSLSLVEEDILPTQQQHQHQHQQHQHQQQQQEEVMEEEAVKKEEEEEENAWWW
jgi:hypothetical protein